MTTRIFAERSFRMNSIALHMAITDDRKTSIVRPVVLEVVEQGQITEPFLSLAPEDAQQLMDQLWHVGLRPSEGSGSAGSLAATERHLADMRAMAFHAMKVPK